MYSSPWHINQSRRSDLIRIKVGNHQKRTLAPLRLKLSQVIEAQQQQQKNA